MTMKYIYITSQELEPHLRVMTTGHRSTVWYDMIRYRRLTCAQQLTGWPARSSARPIKDKNNEKNQIKNRVAQKNRSKQKCVEAVREEERSGRVRSRRFTDQQFTPGCRSSISIVDSFIQRIIARFLMRFNTSWHNQLECQTMLLSCALRTP